MNNTPLSINEIIDLYAKGKYRKALGALVRVAEPYPHLHRRAVALEGEYFYMLRYLLSADGNVKPALEDIEFKFAEILRYLKELMLPQEQTRLLTQRKYMSLRPEESLDSLISDYISESSRLASDTAALTDSRKRHRAEELAQDIFMRLWADLPGVNEHSELLLSILVDTEIPAYDREMWLAAVGLLALRSGDNAVAEILVQMTKCEDLRLRAAAACWCAVFVRRHSGDQPEFIKQPFEERFPAPFREAVAEALMQWDKLMLTEPENMADINSEISGIGQEIQQKLNEGKSLEDISEMDLDRMQRLNSRFMSGADMFGSLGSERGGHAFFERMPNWFLPFHTTHSALADISDSEASVLAETIDGVTLMNDGDKYTILLKLAQIPPHVLKMMMGEISEQLYEFSYRNSMDKNEISLGQTIAAYLVTMRRFYEHYRYATEFDNVLREGPWTLFTVGFISEEQALEEAEKNYAKGNYRAAAVLYNRVMNTPLSHEQHSLAAIANLKDGTPFAAYVHLKALEIGKSDLLYPTSIEFAKFYFDKEQYDQSLHSLQVFGDETDNTDALALRSDIYIAQRRFDDALIALLSLDLMLPQADAAVKSKLAWVQTVQGLYGEAVDNYAMGEDTPLSKYRNALCLWMMGRRAEAVKLMLDTFRTTDVKPDMPRLEILPHENADSAGTSLLFDAVNYALKGSQYGNIL